MPEIVAVAQHADHSFSKLVVPSVRLLKGLGVEGDAHCGATVKHRSRVKIDPTQPNLRQVHLLGTELLEPLAKEGYRVAPGVLGENITTAGIDLLALPTRSRLRLGAEAIVEITGLRNPCQQIEDYQSGLLGEVLERRSDGALLRKAGIMGVVVEGGLVAAGDSIVVELPEGPFKPLERV